MTYLEVHTDEKVHRWEIGQLPKGEEEKDYRARIKFLNKALADFQENMSYAFDEDAKIYIVHESKMNRNGKNIVRTPSDGDAGMVEDKL